MKQKEIELNRRANTLDQISALLKKENQRKQKKKPLSPHVLPRDKRNPSTTNDAAFILLEEPCSSFQKKENPVRDNTSTCDQYKLEKGYDGISIYSPVTYIHREQKNFHQSSSSQNTCINYYKYYEEDYLTDATYRLRMSSWSYRIVDYFGASREIVSIAFNYLDRFIDSRVYSCESAYSYKLASITALHIALKVHNRTTIKATTLADLSKGEISAIDIIHMESIMLKALDYHLCPPTCQTFIVLFAELLPVSVRESSVVSHIINQAMYIAELSTMHLLMKGVKASVASVGAMLKVMDMMVDENALRRDDRLAFLESVDNLFRTSRYNTHPQHAGVLMTKQAGQDQIPSSSADFLSESLWGEVQCCRVLLDEILALNCRQAMDGSDQVLPWKRRRKKEQMTAETNVFFPPQDTIHSYNKKKLPSFTEMISGHGDSLRSGCKTSGSYDSQQETIITAAHHVLLDQRDDCEDVF